jgi:hypothetical protein
MHWPEQSMGIRQGRSIKKSRAGSQKLCIAGAAFAYSLIFYGRLLEGQDFSRLFLGAFARVPGYQAENRCGILKSFAAFPFMIMTTIWNSDMVGRQAFSETLKTLELFSLSF